MHIPLVWFAHEALSRMPAGLSPGMWLFLGDLLLMAFLWWMVRRRFLFSLVPR
jgi:hypothetical protein